MQVIGLAVDQKDLEVVEEFFELFKTPWEYAVEKKTYRVVLSSNDSHERFDAEVFLVYGSGKRISDKKASVAVNCVGGPIDLRFRDCSFPVYGKVGLFDLAHDQVTIEANGKAVDYRCEAEGQVTWRIGYDLFEEVRYLLTKGQPVARSLKPTLEFHIELLRHLLIESKIPFVEIPPSPLGYDYICCLTHDVDFFGIRRHQLDRTMAGFLYRASFGTLIDLVSGRRSLEEAIRNWLAVLALPLVFLKLLPDLWRPFHDYAEVEAGLRSTYYLVPFGGKPGIAPDGSLNPWRATPYGLRDVCEEVKGAAARGNEIGVHGIDAWHDAGSGREEIDELTSVTNQSVVGVRMHWLYYSEASPRCLDEAGFNYDSTWGYNEAIGYRAGTSQVFQPLGSQQLMELPMSIMDSALFSTGRMNINQGEALQLCSEIVSNAKRFGGTLVVNWHERSLAPERLWGNAYGKLLEMIREENRVWFATAAEAVSWFRWRRSISFEATSDSHSGHVRVTASGPIEQGAVVWIHQPSTGAHKVQKLVFDGTVPVEVMT